MKKRLFALAAPAALALTLGACSTDDTASTPEPEPTEASPTVSPVTPTASPTASPTSSPTEVICSKTEIQEQLPQGSTVEKYTCAATGSEPSSEYWAAAEVSQGPTVFFLQANDARTKWVEVLDEDEICGTASAGLPPEILDYC